MTRSALNPESVAETIWSAASALAGLSALSLNPAVYPNGDQVQFLDLTFACRRVSGTARVADEENLEVSWFAASALPELSPDDRDRIRRAGGVERETYFER